MSSLTTTIPAGSLVLVTGATGFVASHTTRELLERGYKVRGTVRNLNQAQWLIDNYFKSYSDKGYLQLVEVPDLGVDGAYDAAVKGVSAIAHIATISSLDPDPNKVVPQTIAGVTSILKAAAKESSVKEIVFTSSFITATVPIIGNNFRLHVERNTWNDAAVEAAWAPPPYEPARALATYAASKVSAEKEIWRIVEEDKPHFTVNVVNPSSIVGEPLHKKHADAPVNMVNSLYGGPTAGPINFHAVNKLLTLPYVAYFVDVKDIATLHVAAMLDPEVKSARLQTWGHGAHVNELLAALRELRPQRKFMEDFPDPYHLDITTDQSQSVRLLQKWTGQKDGWRPMKQSVSESINNPYFTAE